MTRRCSTLHDAGIVLKALLRGATLIGAVPPQDAHLDAAADLQAGQAKSLANITGVAWMQAKAPSVGQCFGFSRGSRRESRFA